MSTPPRPTTRLAILGAAGAAPLVSRLEGDVIRIGRGGDNDLVLPDVSSSRCHAEIRREGAAWRLHDMGSLNGTHLNGRRVARDEILEPGDRIVIGTTTILFDPPAASLARVVAFPVTQEIQASGEAGLKGGASASAAFVGETDAARKVRALVQRVAPSDASILLTGENGTGKEVLARVIHQLSPRRARPFVTVNCPAIPEGLVEAELFGTEKGVATSVDARVGRIETAQGGTLFLDEVGDLAPGAQAKLLRFLQERTIERVGGRKPIPMDVRVIAATNQDLDTLVAEGRFRRDLLYRLEVVRIEIPPLRERRADIPLLCEHVLARWGAQAPALSPEARDALLAHDFPGNVRELEHALQRAVLIAEGGVILPADLPRSIRRAEAQPRETRADGEALWTRVRVEGASFWDAVHAPFTARNLPREEVRGFIARLHAEAGGSYKRMAALLGIADEYRRFVDFLRHNKLRPED